jgi:hypothetical protein
MMIAEHSIAFTVVLNEEERGALLQLLEESLMETHAEKRRTEAPGYHEQLVHQEAMIRMLIDKVRRLQP